MNMFSVKFYFTLCKDKYIHGNLEKNITSYFKTTRLKYSVEYHDL